MFGLMAAGAATVAVGAGLSDHERFAIAAKPYRALIEAAAHRYGISRHIIAALLWRETRFTPTKTGKAGEAGISQVMSIAIQDLTASGFREFTGVTVQDCYKPEIGINVAAAYLALNKKRLGSTYLSLRAYNVGPDLKSKPTGDNGVAYMSDIVYNAVIDFLYVNLDSGSLA